MSHHIPSALTRRDMLGATALAGAAAALPAQATPTPAANSTYRYEVTRSEAEWRAQLSPLEYRILREGGTEPRQSSLNAFEERAGAYHCVGCALPVFTSDWKVPHFDIGWAFFQQAEPDSILTGIDLNFDMSGQEDRAVIECHCRRCGSHLGHILHVRGEVLHCVNGASLHFLAA